MKKQKLTRMLLCLMLSVVMLLSAVSCGEDDTKDPAQTTASAGETAETTAGNGGGTNPSTPSDEEFYKPKEKDYNREMTIMTAIGSYFGTADGYKEGDGTILDDAVFKRAQLMNEKFGVDVIVTDGNEAGYTTSALSGTYICDYLVLGAQASFRILQKNLLVDLAQLSSLNLGAPYWDQRIQNDYAIGDRIYLMEGDYTYNDEYRTYVMLYNDKLYTDYGYYEKYGTPYSLVESGDWTMDLMLEMAKDRYVDKNFNETADEFDEYGIVGAMNIQWCCFLGSGLKTVSTNNGELTLNIQEEGYYNRVYDVLEDVMQKFTKNKDVLQPNLLKDPSVDIWTAASNVFETNRALFRGTTLSAATRLDNMSARFGVLPMPAYEKGTNNYYGWLPGDSHSPLSMCRNVTDKEETAAILETFCYYSRYGKDSLYNAYFESFRISKFCETEEDLKMMNLIIETKTYDLDFSASITDIADVIWSMGMAEDISAFGSTMTTKRNAANQAMTDFVLKILELD